MEPLRHTPIRPCVPYCSHIGMDMDQQQKPCGIETLLSCYEGAQSVPETLPHTITPPLPAHNVDTSQNGSMLSCRLHQMNVTASCHLTQHWAPYSQYHVM